MNSIQNYGSVNVNANYGKVNKNPNFKAFTHINGGKESLEKMGKNIETFVKYDCGSNFGLKVADDNINCFLQHLKAALNLKKAANGTNYLDGVFIGKSLDSGIKFKNSKTIYTTPFRFSEKEGSRVIEGKVLEESDTTKLTPIMELTEEEAAKLQDFSAASVLEACENSIKQKINQIRNLTNELLN